MAQRNFNALMHTVATIGKRNAEAEAERKRMNEVDRAVDIFEKAKAEIEALGCRIDVAENDEIGVFIGSKEDFLKTIPAPAECPDCGVVCKCVSYSIGDSATFNCPEHGEFALEYEENV